MDSMVATMIRLMGMRTQNKHYTPSLLKANVAYVENIDTQEMTVTKTEEKNNREVRSMVTTQI